MLTSLMTGLIAGIAALMEALAAQAAGLGASVHGILMSTLGLVEGIMETWVDVTPFTGPPAGVNYDLSTDGEALIGELNMLVNKMMVLMTGVGFNVYAGP